MPLADASSMVPSNAPEMIMAGGQSGLTLAAFVILGGFVMLGVVLFFIFRPQVQAKIDAEKEEASHRRTMEEKMGDVHVDTNTQATRAAQHARIAAEESGMIRSVLPDILTCFRKINDHNQNIDMTEELARISAKLESRS